MQKSFTSQLKLARERLGLHEVAAAAMLGLSNAGYDDLENDENEWQSVVPARIVNNVVNFFDVDWRPCRAWPSGTLVAPGQAIDELCRSLRTQHGLSREEFADRVGFFSSFCEVIEGHPDGLSLWPIDAVVHIAEAFSLDAASLVAVLLKPEDDYSWRWRGDAMTSERQH
jgi:transcriptional regulator with XRE-family HTH domain